MLITISEQSQCNRQSHFLIMASKLPSEPITSYDSHLMHLANASSLAATLVVAATRALEWRGAPRIVRLGSLPQPCIWLRSLNSDILVESKVLVISSWWTVVFAMGGCDWQGWGAFGVWESSIGEKSSICFVVWDCVDACGSSVY